jgi:hypothetical protein
MTSFACIAARRTKEAIFEFRATEGAGPQTLARHMASQCGHLPMALLLIEGGADRKTGTICMTATPKGQQATWDKGRPGLLPWHGSYNSLKKQLF